MKLMLVDLVGSVNCITAHDHNSRCWYRYHSSCGVIATAASTLWQLATILVLLYRFPVPPDTICHQTYVTSGGNLLLAIGIERTNPDTEARKLLLLQLLLLQIPLLLPCCYCS